jgi:hypothetical protein
MTTLQWIACSQIENDCSAQFVGRNNVLAALFCRVAIEFQIEGSVWR